MNLQRLFNVAGIALVTIGTVFTLWSMLVATGKSIGTWGEGKERRKNFPSEKRRTIIGCTLIIVGGLFQSIGQFDVPTLKVNETVCLKVAVYILSISLQVAGALAMVFGSLSLKRKNLVMSFVRNTYTKRDTNTDEVFYNHNTFKELYKSRVIARLSFVAIALGYLLGVFGSIGEANRWMVCGMVAGLSAILLFAIFGVGCVVTNKSPIANDAITAKELNDYSIEANEDNISNKQVDDLFETDKDGQKRQINNKKGEYTNA